jgi:hypothetical protein
MKEKKTLLGTIKSMKNGDVLSFPIERVTTVRASATVVSMQLRREYKTYTDREKGIIVVERTK